MKKTKKLFYNTILLTLASMLLRAIGVYFQIFLSNKIGSAGIGLFQLVGSVQSLAITIALSGIRFATTRMVSEELGLQRPGGVHKVLRHCLLYGLFFGILAMSLMYFFANYIGEVWIGDSRTILSLKILSFTMPFISLIAVMGGYFTAVQRVIKTASVQIVDNLVMVGATILFLNMCPKDNLELSCAAIVAGAATSEIVSFFLLAILFLHDKKKLKGGDIETRHVTSRLFKISMPLALSTYARSALSTLEHMLVPRGLRRSGISGNIAMSTYGVIHGMVFPILLFPSVLFYSLGEMIIPELTECQVSGKKSRIEFIVNRILSLCLFLSIGIAGILVFFHNELGGVLYKNGDAGYYILIFALLVPVMYMDAITDGMLKGLGQQLHSMVYNIADSFISVVLVYTLLPLFAIKGYIFMVYFTECFNFILSIRRISKVTKVKFSLKNILVPILAIVSSANLTIAFLRIIGLPLKTSAISLILHIALSAVIYLVLLVVFNCVTEKDLKWFIKLAE